MIVVVDTGGANLASVGNALDRLGAAWRLTRDGDTISRAERVILPGVGAAGDSMARLRQDNLVATLRALRQPTLGICLGMQLLFARSAEDDTDCLGIIPGRVERIPTRPGLPVPHMGWNQVEPTRNNPLLSTSAYFYFVHSYRAPLAAHTVGTCDYGDAVCAIVQHENFFGCQFHPERSGKSGQALLQRFVTL